MMRQLREKHGSDYVSSLLAQGQRGAVLEPPVVRLGPSAALPSRYTCNIGGVEGLYGIFRETHFSDNTKTTGLINIAMFVTLQSIKTLQ